MHEDQLPINIDIKRAKILLFCENLGNELIAAVEEGRTVNVDVMHLKSDLMSSGIVKVSINLSMDLEGGFISLQAEADNFKIHKDYDYPIIPD